MEHPKTQFLFICGLIRLNSNLIVKECLLLFGGKSTKMANIGLILASNIQYHFRFWNQHLEFVLSQISVRSRNKEFLNFKESRSLKQKMTSKVFLVILECLSNFKSTPNFVMTELETTKLEGDAIIANPHTLMFLKWSILNSVNKW